ncbi:hypothetical protein BH23PLA1_BH23PLA1_22000 [soil metagenome]
MSMRSLIRFSGSLMVLGALFLVLPGCGDGGQTVGADGEVEIAPPLNPAPGALESEENFDERM